MDTIKGVKNRETKKPVATTMAVIPVLPPSRMPEADSMYTVRGAQPKREPRIMATPSTQKANTWRGKALVRSSMNPVSSGRAQEYEYNLAYLC